MSSVCEPRAANGFLLKRFASWLESAVIECSLLSLFGLFGAFTHSTCTALVAFFTESRPITLMLLMRQMTPRFLGGGWEGDYNGAAVHKQFPVGCVGKVQASLRMLSRAALTNTLCRGQITGCQKCRKSHFQFLNGSVESTLQSNAGEVNLDRCLCYFCRTLRQCRLEKRLNQM